MAKEHLASPKLFHVGATSPVKQVVVLVVADSDVDAIPEAAQKVVRAHKVALADVEVGAYGQVPSSFVTTGTDNNQYEVTVTIKRVTAKRVKL